mmetsp:Transcript_29217/g.42680  ORF Transcript_29217/g.42680 Transcript_29217/m.42680 type:complete len:326 (-) Transcript_29217:159-1136(-)
MNRFSKLVHWLTICPMLPESLLVPILNSTRLTRFAYSSGIGPTRSLNANIINSRFVSWPNVDGKEPCKFKFLRLSVVRLTRLPNSFGIVPVISSLKLRSNTRNSTRPPISLGRFPSKSSLSNFICVIVISSSAHVIPSKAHSVTETSSRVELSNLFSGVSSSLKITARMYRCVHCISFVDFWSASATQHSAFLCGENGSSKRASSEIFWLIRDDRMVSNCSDGVIEASAEKHGLRSIGATVGARDGTFVSSIVGGSVPPPVEDSGIPTPRPTARIQKTIIMAIVQRCSLNPDLNAPFKFHLAYESTLEASGRTSWPWTNSREEEF